MEPPNLLVLFILGLVTDILWCALTKAVNQRRAVKSATFSMGLEGLKLATAWIVIRSDSLPCALAFMLGCGIGTYFSARFR